MSPFQGEFDSSSLLLCSLNNILKDKVMNNSLKKKQEQLGMPLGTASAKLRKNILFNLLKETGKNICYQCGKLIDNEDELSIEHKIPYLDSEDPKKLFFSLDNIAFSHLKCNIGAARHPITKMKVIHQDRARNGLHALCKLSGEEVKKIRELSTSMKGVEIAKSFGVSKHTIYRILKGKTFSYV